MNLENRSPKIIKIVYYTYPLCEIGLRMQESWKRFLDTYHGQVSFQFCLAMGEKDPRAVAQADPSSYSTCLAVKAAGLQSATAASLYLSKLREAGMEGKRDISQVNVLVDVAREVNKLHREQFDLHRFGEDFDAKATRKALMADMEKINVNRISTFPTVTLTLAGKGIKMTGFCSYQQLTQAMQKLLASVQTNFKQMP